MKQCVLRLVASAAVLAAAAPAPAEISVFSDEASYLSALASLGYDMLVEDFEGADWDPYRTTDPFNPQSAPSVTSQGITWVGNNEISTNTNWGLFETWGIFTISGGPWTPDALYVTSDNVLFGVGGWFDSNPDFGADFALRIRGEIVATRNAGAGHVFFGVIDTCGFQSFDIIDVHDHGSAWGADDFTFAVGGAFSDCNANGLSDECDIEFGLSEDCNMNGVPDECDTGADCNANGILDECDVVDGYVAASGQLTPIGHGAPQSFTIAAPPSAHSDVVLTFTAYANLGGLNQFVSVDVNGVPVGTVLGVDGSDCPEAAPDAAMLTIPMETFNSAVSGGDAVINMIASAEVAPDECDNPSYITVDMLYFVPSGLDLDGNGIPDECEPAVPGDIDGDGVVGILDFLALLGLWGPCPHPCPPSCPADLDDDCTVGIIDFLLLLGNWTVSIP